MSKDFFKGKPVYDTYRLEGQQMPTTVSTTKEEMMRNFEDMAIMRRMEVECDKLYKAKKIRGFCHLYDGQESIAQGMELGLTWDDCLITAYRNHCQALARGDTPYRIIAEMMGKATGSSKGKGGSMHYYNTKNNYYGGNGIVGAQLPVGTGLAFGLKYEKKPNCAIAMYGDGAANQGQLYEAANMAKLWSLPMIYLCENNLYGMGTSNERASHNTKFYARGDLIPGLKCDAQNVLVVKETMKWAKKWAVDGNGPLFIEFLTYRYHGHSMSDPGVTYRTREEIQEVRQNRDPIEIARKIILDHSWSTEKELKDIEKNVRKNIDNDIKKAESDPFPAREELYTDVMGEECFIRGVTYEESINQQK
jgi:pyruvate dehydrogenase E1 component alpha subunit